MLHCVLNVCALLSREMALPYLPQLLTAENKNQKLIHGTIACDFSLPKHLLTSTKSCIYYKGAWYWNSLLSSITTVVCNKSFLTNRTKCITTSILKQ